MINADEEPIRLAAQVPIRFTPYKSFPRLPGENPYKRLVLMSSRVHESLKVWPVEAKARQIAFCLTWARSNI